MVTGLDDLTPNDFFFRITVRSYVEDNSRFQLLTAEPFQLAALVSSRWSVGGTAFCFRLL